MPLGALTSPRAYCKESRMRSIRYDNMAVQFGYYFFGFEREKNLADMILKMLTCEHFALS